MQQLHLHVVGPEVAERDDRLHDPLGAEVGERVVELDVVDVHAGPGRLDLGLPAGQLPGGGVAVGAEHVALGGGGLVELLGVVAHHPGGGDERARG